MTEIKNSIFAGLAFGLVFGVYIAIKYGIYYSYTAAPLSGILFGLLIYLFVTSKIVKQQEQIEILNGESIIYSGLANHFLNGVAVGGRLYLLTDKIQFQSHSFNVQNEEFVININQISEVGFYYTLGIMPTGLYITTFDGQTEKFVVSNRRFWKEEIEKQKNQN